MYPFIDQFVPSDFPSGLLTFINTIILFHLAALAFYFVGLFRDLVFGVPAAKPKAK